VDSNDVSQRLEETDDLESLIHSYDRFVPYQLLEMLDKKSILDVELGNHVEKKLTIMFADIRNFTALSENLTPMENFNFINSYLSRMEPVINRHNGIIDKFIGDAIMALFPTCGDDALQCSVALLQEVRRYNEDRKKAGYKPIAIGIGLNTGLSMLGTIGGFTRMEGTVISDAVNLSSRLESLTKDYQVQFLISENTYHSLVDPEQYHIRFIDRVMVKGKRQPQSVYEIFDEDDDRVMKLKKENKALFEDALAHYHYKKIDTAKTLLQQCLKLNPFDKPAKCYLKKCNDYLQTGIFMGAKELNERLSWCSDFEIGIAEIDVQHQKLFADSFNLLDMIEQERTTEETMETIDLLEKFVKNHFLTEEKYMAESAYPFFDHQQEQHARFLLAFERLKTDICRNEFSKTYLMFRFQILWVDWLINHTLKEDRHFGRFRKLKKRR
jgi:hemerythrin